MRFTTHWTMGLSVLLAATVASGYVAIVNKTDNTEVHVVPSPGKVTIDGELLDVLCERQFGKAAATCRELLRLECARWAKTPWRKGLGNAGRVSVAVFADTYPPEVVAKMTALHDRAKCEMASDTLLKQRFAYWTWTFDYFLGEAKDAWAKTGVAPAAANPLRNRYP